MTTPQLSNLGKFAGASKFTAGNETESVARVLNFLSIFTHSQLRPTINNLIMYSDSNVARI